MTDQDNEKAWQIAAELLEKSSVLWDEDGNGYCRLSVMTNVCNSEKFEGAINAMLQGDPDPIADLITSEALKAAQNLV